MEVKLINVMQFQWSNRGNFTILVGNCLVTGQNTNNVLCLVYSLETSLSNTVALAYQYFLATWKPKTSSHNCQNFLLTPRVEFYIDAPSQKQKKFAFLISKSHSLHHSLSQFFLPPLTCTSQYSFNLNFHGYVLFFFSS